MPTTSNRQTISWTDDNDKFHEIDITITSTGAGEVFTIDIEGGYGVIEDVDYSNNKNDRFELHVGGRPSDR